MPWTISDSGSGLAFHFGFWIQFWFRFRFGFVAIATWSATEARHNWPKLNRDYSIPKFPKKKIQRKRGFYLFSSLLAFLVRFVACVRHHVALFALFSQRRCSQDDVGEKKNRDKIRAENTRNHRDKNRDKQAGLGNANPSWHVLWLIFI